jgi:toxin HigB-1
MEISFANKKLEKYANNDKLRLKSLGKRRGYLFKQRLDELLIADTLEDVRHLPGNYHELIRNRKGQWACDLDHPYRLVFEPLEKPIPKDESGKYIWIKIIAVEIIEITDYH